MKENEVMAEVEYVQYVKVFGIKWDADDMSDVEDLPKEIEVPVTLSMIESEVDSIDEVDEIVEEYISNYLSDNYGFTHDGFRHSSDKSFYFENSFQDYQDRDGNFVSEGTIIGNEVDGEIILLDGIYLADAGRVTYLSFNEKN